MADDPVADVLAVFDVFETGLVWHCMCAVTRLDVPDRLAGGPLAVPQLAAGACEAPSSDRESHKGPLQRDDASDATVRR